MDEVGGRARRLAALEERVTQLEGERLQVINVERLELGDDDVLFVHVAAETEPEEMNEVARIVADHLGTRRVLMLAGETTVSVGKLPPDARPALVQCSACAGSGTTVAGGAVCRCETCKGSGLSDA